MDKTIALVPNDRCTGCGSCLNACPASAITLEYDAEGFLYPQIDEDKCVHCGKCYQTCPETDYEKTAALFHPRGESYAVMASDEIRAVSSSGGMFTLLADYVLEQGGLVFGAAYVEDFLSVHHIGVDGKEDLQKLRSSKYVQSNTEETYRQTKEALDTGRSVLYTGCPCQIAGLYRFLEKDYENLLTADTVCHGSNSTYAYRSFLEEIAAGRRITRVDFREKAHYGWTSNVNVYFSDGTDYIEHPKQSLWKRAFLEGVINRRCCHQCHYTQLSRVADLTLGDFWKVTQLNPEWNDKKGTSLVLVNTQKGKDVLRRLEPKMKLCAAAPFDEEFAKKANGQLVRPTKQHVARSLFFEEMLTEGFHKAAEKARSMNPESSPIAPKAPVPPPKNKAELIEHFQDKVRKNHFDVGLTGYWWSSNYGSVATYYALYRLIEKLGYSVILIDRPDKETHGDGLDVFSRKFMESHCNTSVSLRDSKDLTAFNTLCDTFMIGSDQVWGPGAIKAYQYFFFLDFIRPEKKKIAYAASFGEHFRVPEEQRLCAKEYINQFDAVSVREKQAVQICKESFGVDAAWVLDPVFLLDRAEYDRLSDKSKRSVEDVLGSNKGYLLSYILNPSEEKRKMLLEASERLHLPMINILHGKAHSFEKNSQIMNLPNMLEDVGEEEWLFFIKNASFVITDSHHGSVFSMIYNKPFICCSDKKWGQARYESLFGLFGIKERQSITTEDMLSRNLLFTEIDYAHVNQVLAEQRGKSLKWLSDALAKAPKPDAKKALEQENEKLRKQQRRLEKQVKDLKKSLKNEKKHYNSVIHSRSYRIGRFLTAPARGIRNLFSSSGRK